MTLLHDTGELTCPRCGTVLKGDFGTVPVDTSKDQIRIEIDCPECSAPLVALMEMALPEALGVDMWVEDREGDDG
jgi:predicted nucleic acid-binding Zn ribbon protein